ncbi:protein FAR1-RELATED SEQUENCE 12-like protein [Corchorus olitorius]|uniref:Protein FAR1-RELATED SEQUENCE 12-like protein n=1 Tax=Corchorus olitorius TaxID=93759 RepID=A0A1R3GY84_9ROSI|nr:protein FAR1-RELATED SEQUENCE 12-like protein [Corchorus olitorius]
MAFVREKNETEDSLSEYVFAIYGQIDVGKVVYNDEEMTVSCSCKKFEMEGDDDTVE